MLPRVRVFFFSPIRNLLPEFWDWRKVHQSAAAQRNAGLSHQISRSVVRFSTSASCSAPVCTCWTLPSSLRPGLGKSGPLVYKSREFTAVRAPCLRPRAGAGHTEVTFVHDILHASPEGLHKCSRAIRNTPALPP